MWHDRLDNSGLWLETWLQHQRRDDYWRHGSVNENYDDIDIPVFAVSGWADGYSNAVFRLLRGLKSPTRGLIGPWSHKYPHLGQPGPAIGFLQEVVAWWDYWLKDRTDNGAMDGPQLSIWMQDAVKPATTYDNRPGRWVGERAWPSDRIVETRYPLGRRRILFSEAERAALPVSPKLTVESPLSVGQFGGKWCSYNAPPDMPYDQREEDGGSLVFDSDPLPHRLEVLGQPVLELTVSADDPVAMVAVRLSDVAPDDAATRVSYGILNLNHYAGSDQPKPLTKGEEHTYRVKLNGLTQSFPAGHRLRVSVSTSYWPVVWPSPSSVRLTIDPMASSLILPVRPTHQDDDPAMIPVFDRPEGAKPLKTVQIEPGAQDWSVSRNLVELTGKLEVVKDLGVVRFKEIDLDVTRRVVERYTFRDADPNSVRGETEWVMGFERDDWSIYTFTKTVLTSTPEAFHLYAELDAYEGERRVRSKTWTTKIDRDFI